jgi:hypothetical protein
MVDSTSPEHFPAVNSSVVQLHPSMASPLTNTHGLPLSSAPVLTLISDSTFGTFPHSGPTSDQKISFQLVDSDSEQTWQSSVRFDSSAWQDTSSSISSTGTWTLTLYSSNFRGARITGGVHVLSLRVTDSSGDVSNTLYIAYEVANVAPSLQLLSSSSWGHFNSDGPTSDQTIEFRLTDSDSDRSWSLFRKIGSQDWIYSGSITPGVRTAIFTPAELRSNSGSWSYQVSIYVADSLWSASNTLTVTYDYGGIVPNYDEGMTVINNGIPAVLIIIIIVVIVVVVSSVIGLSCYCVRKNRERNAAMSLTSVEGTGTYAPMAAYPAPGFGAPPGGPFQPQVGYAPQYYTPGNPGVQDPQPK